MRSVLLFLLVATSCSAQDLPSYSEAVAAYRQNIASGLPISVEWLVTQYEFPAAIEWEVANNAILRMALKENLDSGLRERLTQKLADDEKSVTEEAREVRLRPKVRRHFLWTDGRLIHYRYHDDPSVELDTDFGASLADGFTDRKLYSFDPDRVPKLRVWQGYAADGKTLTGYIGTQDIGGLVDRSFLPPLGFIKEEWKRSQRFSVLDKWTGQLPGVQDSAQGGDDTVLIRNVTGGDPPGVGVDRLSVWCAYQKGFVPKKIEFSKSGGPPTVVAADEYPVRIRETIDVEGIEEISGMFYPKRITSTTHSMEAKWHAANPGGPDERTAVPYVPYSVRIEEILAVKVRRQIPQHWLDLPFPPQTRFMDMDTKEMYLEGVPKAEFDRQMVQELTKGTGVDMNRVPLKPGDRPAPWIFVAINAGAVVLLSLLFAYSRRRSRGAE